jgi:hypothetical protein
MYRLIFSLLYEIENSAIKPDSKLYKTNPVLFRELIILVSNLGLIRGEIITFTDLYLTGARLTQKGKNFLKEHSYFLYEYPMKSKLYKWVRQEAVYTRRI